jgi:hypothetical protein
LKHKRPDSTGHEEYTSGLNYPGQSLNVNFNATENQATHPYNNGAINATGGYGNLPAGMINGDSDPYPRAIISKCWTYNHEHNLAPYDRQTSASNAYFASYFSKGMDISSTTNSGCVPMSAANTNDVSYTSNFPMLSLMESLSTS